MNATLLFCAFGGVGVVPDPLPPGYVTELAAFVVAIDNPGPPIGRVSFSSAALLDGPGSPVAAFRGVDHVVVLAGIDPTSPSMGTFAVYLNPEGTPFDGTLPTGRTILRAHFALDHDPIEYPERCRLHLDGLGAPLVVTARVDGSWPT